MSDFRYNRAKKEKGGYTLVEMVIYSAILAVVTVLVASSVLKLGGAFVKAKSYRKLNSIGNVALERIIRETRLATAVSSITSNPGDVTLNTYDAPESQTQTTIRFYLDGNEIKMQQGTDPASSITPSDLIVTKLVFTHLCASGPCPADVSEGIRVEMNTITGSGKKTASTTLHGFAILRGSYNE